MRSNRLAVAITILAIFTLILFMAVPPSSAQERVIYSFVNNGVDGVEPYGPLAVDSAGNLYGTTMTGGANGCGVVYELSYASGVWVEKILHSFGAPSDGCEPLFGAPVLDNAGNLYGTTATGGSYNGGTAWQLQRAAGWNEKILHNFGNGSDGINPVGSLLVDSAYNFFGDTRGTGDSSACGGYGCGTVFELRFGTWQETILNNSCDCGALGSGMAFGGGNLFVNSNSYNSAILELVGGTSNSAFIYTFPNSELEGWGPVGGLAFDKSGNLYGTTEVGGAPGYGVAYKLTPAAGQWTQTVLYEFQGPLGAGADGAEPFGLISDSYGNLYGTTHYGGAKGAGTVFMLTPAVPVWHETILYSFGTNPGDVFLPITGLTFLNGNLYGTSPTGGANGMGGVFEIIR